MRSTSRQKATEASSALRVLDTGAGHPTWNMGLDEALLLLARQPTLRFYRWSPPGLSLGYFQRASDFADTEGDHVVVRRLTGGGAIYHDHELTISLVVPAAALPGRPATSHGIVSRAVAAALATMGIVTETADGRAAAPQPRPTEPWCFASASSCDLVAPSGGKLFGSAQRRIRTPAHRILHHGSLIIRPPHQVPRCAGIADQGPLDLLILQERLARALADALGYSHGVGALTVAETTLAARLAQERYGCPEFTNRR